MEQIDNLSFLNILSVYSLKRSLNVRQYLIRRRRRRRIILNGFLESLKAHAVALERIINIYKPPQRLIYQIYRPIEVGQDLLEKVNGNRFSSEFRISRDNFEYICDVLRTELEPKFNPLSINQRKASVEEKVAICLYKLKSRCEYAVVANVFGFSPASVYNYVHIVIKAIVKHLVPIHIRMPDINEAKLIAEEFIKITGIPQIIGCIDGSHIPITAPVDGGKDYLNRKGYHSIILQAVVDHKCRFRDICCKFPGSVHDALVFKGSYLYIRRAEIFPPSDYFINGINIPYLLIGDPAYPLLPWVLKDYPGQGLDQIKSNFNLKLNSGRVKVEQAFGMLKKTFRILGAQSEIDVEFMPLLVAACCTLYNIIQDDIVTINDHIDQIQQEEHESNVERDRPTPSANSVRDVIANFLEPSEEAQSSEATEASTTNILI